MENEQIVKEILDFIEKTGTVLIQEGFRISVKFVIAQGIGQLIASLGSWAIFGILAKKLYTLFKLADEDEVSENAFGFKVGVYILLGIGFLATAIFNSPIEAIQKLIAPEWYALLNIVNLIK